MTPKEKLIRLKGGPVIPTDSLVQLALVGMLAALLIPSASAQPLPPQSLESAQTQAQTVEAMRNVGTALFEWLSDQVNDDNAPGSADPMSDTACRSPIGERLQLLVRVDLVHCLVHHGAMSEVNVHEAKTHLSRLLLRVAGGEEIVIARAGKPIARLVPIEPKPQRVIGQDDGLFEVPEDFDAPLPDEVLALFQS